MLAKIEKSQSGWRKYFGNISKLLFEIWNPLGVENLKDAIDEYNDISFKIYNLLLSNAPSKQIVDLILDYENRVFEINPNTLRANNVAEALLQLIAR